MSTKATAKKNYNYIKSLGGETMFFRGEHPDKRSSVEWIRYMNKKYPHLKWKTKDAEA